MYYNILYIKIIFFFKYNLIKLLFFLTFLLYIKFIYKKRNLYGGNINGTIPESIGNLTELTGLYVILLYYNI